MATVLDVGILNYFSPIVVFLFVFVATYGVLEVTKILGAEAKNLHAIFALCAALFVTMAPQAMAVIQGAAPWFVLLFVFGIFLLVGMRFTFGDKGDDILIEVLGGKVTAGWWVFGVSIAIVGMMLASVVSPSLLPASKNQSTTTTETSVSPGTSGSTGTADWRTNVLNTIYHPKLLGAVVVLFIGAMAIKFLSFTQT